MLEITLAIIGGIGRAGGPPPPHAKQRHRLVRALLREGQHLDAAACLPPPPQSRSSPPRPALTQQEEPDHMSDIEWLYWFTDRLEPQHRKPEENDQDGFWPSRP
jgi:hypothetical protein